MRKIYFLVLFTATVFSCVASNAKKNDMHRIAEKHIEKVKNIVKTNAENLPLKSAKAQSHLDSITLDNGSMGVFYYNEAGLFTDYKGYSLNYLDELELVEHQQFEYDNAGRETLFALNFKDAFDGWIILEKTESQYDANGNVTSEIYWDYDYGEGEHPSEKYEYQYDGNEMRSDSYEWDEDLDDWLHTSYSIILVDGLRPVSGEMFMYDYDAGEFLPAMQLEFEYNSAGLETMNRLSMYDEESGENVVFNSSEYEYDSNNRILVERERMQMPGFIDLIDETRYTYENGNRVKEEVYSNGGYLPNLELMEYYEYVYNGNTLFSETYFLRQMDDDSFVSTSKYVFTYDTSIDPDNYYIPNVSAHSDDYYHLDEQYHQFGLLEKVTHYTIIDWDTNEMAESMVADYFYSGGTSVGVQTLDIPNVEVYPMPFRNYIELNNQADNKLKSFEMFTLDGKSIKSGKITGDAEKYSIETAELGNGIYILSLVFENEQLFYQRVVKQ